MEVFWKIQISWIRIFLASCPLTSYYYFLTEFKSLVQHWEHLCECKTVKLRLLYRHSLAELYDLAFSMDKSTSEDKVECTSVRRQSSCLSALTKKVRHIFMYKFYLIPQIYQIILNFIRACFEGAKYGLLIFEVCFEIFCFIFLFGLGVEKWFWLKQATLCNFYVQLDEN